jgi:hypothetical protein
VIAVLFYRIKGCPSHDMSEVSYLCKSSHFSVAACVLDVAGSNDHNLHLGEDCCDILCDNEALHRESGDLAFLKLNLLVSGR